MSSDGLQDFFETFLVGESGSLGAGRDFLATLSGSVLAALFVGDVPLLSSFLDRGISRFLKKNSRKAKYFSYLFLGAFKYLQLQIVNVCISYEPIFFKVRFILYVPNEAGCQTCWLLHIIIHIQLGNFNYYTKVALSPSLLIITTESKMTCCPRVLDGQSD